MATKDSNALEISVSVKLENADRADKLPAVAAYAFSSEGRLLSAAALDGKDGAVLRLPPITTVANLRVLIGPKLDEKAPSYDELIRRGAVEQHLRLDAGTLRQSLVVPIFPPIWNCWLRSACFVRGNLYKRVLIGGKYVNFPVCNATVEVYEVDPIWIIIPKLPIAIIDKLREIILNPQPIPFPEPIPGPDPAPFARTAMLQAARETGHSFNAAAAETLGQLSSASGLRFAAQAGSALQFQQALIDHAVLIRPLLCLFYPHFVTTQRVATAHTDQCGHFQTLFFQGCNNHDVPDLYFKATQKLFGFLDVYIYAPTPIACHTWWNYQCGTEVNLYTSSPWAQTCAPCPPVIGPNGKNRWVAFMAIGGLGLNHIYGASPNLAGSVTAANRGLTDGGAPFGGLLLPRLEFSNELEAAGVRYYQLSWRRGSTGTFLPLAGEVHHFYRHDVTTMAGNLPVWSPQTLGPLNVNDGGGHQVPNLFAIPFPSVAPAGVWDTPPDISQIREHFASAKMPSTDIAPGTHYDGNGVLVGSDVGGPYQIKVDLFDGHGQPVDIAALGIVYAVPEDPDAGGAINTVDAATLGLVHGNSMIITLHVDNNRCYAAIDAPTIGAAAADPCCGVLKYQAGDSVTLAWRTQHPNGFANYTFGVVRGTASVPSVPIVSGAPLIATNPSPVAVSVAHLLNDNLPPGCAVDGCPVAGFSENLYVNALATDGWTSELGYDASAVRAFVLAHG
jgi:hypothetical protein